MDGFDSLSVFACAERDFIAYLPCDIDRQSELPDGLDFT